MLLASFSWIKSERFWRIAIFALFFLGFLGGVFIGALLIFPPPPGSFGLEKESLELTQSVNEEQVYDATLSGALSLNEGISSRFLPLLISEIQLLGVNTRPGHVDANKLLLKLKSSGEELTVTEGQPFFLKTEESDEGRFSILGFAKEKTSLRLTPLCLWEGGGRIEVGLTGLQGEMVTEERGEIVIEKSSDLLSEASYFKQLKEAKWWGVDALIRQYGGEDFSKKKESHKLEIMNAQGSGICFVAPGDYLFWDGESWQEGVKEVLSGKTPIAQVTQITAQVIELNVWDETGYHSQHLKLTPQFISKRPLNLDCLPTSIRMRSESQISCLLSKRRFLLKEGDWVLRTPLGWRILNRASDIEGYLAHRIKGELFIFDKLEKQQGRVVIKGHYFDDMRTQMQKVAVPVVAEKKIHKRKTKIIYK